MKGFENMSEAVGMEEATGVVFADEAAQRRQDVQPASFGWAASNGVLERLNPPPRVYTEPKKTHIPRSFQLARREAVRREVQTFLKAELRRQVGIAKLLETIHIIDKLDTDFGTYTQFGRTLRSELGELKRKLKVTQKTFSAADGGFLQTYALARKRRIAQAERWEGKDGFVDYDSNGIARVSEGGDLDLGEDEALEARLRLEQDMLDTDLRLEKIWDADVMLYTDVEELLREAKDLKEAAGNTMMTHSFNANNLYVRLDNMESELRKLVSALTDERETTFDLDFAPQGRALVVSDGLIQGSMDEYLAESKSKVDELFATMQQRRSRTLEFCSQFGDKSAEISAELRAENEKLRAEILANLEAQAEALKLKDLEVKKAEAEAAKQRKIMTDDYKRLVMGNEKEMAALRAKYEAQLEAANQALLAESTRAQELDQKLKREMERYNQASHELEAALSERAFLKASMELNGSRCAELEALIDSLQQQLDAAGDGGDGDRLKGLENQLGAARQKLFAEESKAVELENTIRALKKEKRGLKKHAEQLQAKMAGMDSELLDAINFAQSEFEKITGGAAEGGKEKKSARERETFEQDRARELKQLKQKQVQEQEQVMREAKEAMAKKEREMERQKQEMLEKMQQLRAQKQADKLPKEKKEKKKKEKPPKDQLSAAAPFKTVPISTTLADTDTSATGSALQTTATIAPATAPGPHHTSVPASSAASATNDAPASASVPTPAPAPAPEQAEAAARHASESTVTSKVSHESASARPAGQETLDQHPTTLEPSVALTVHAEVPEVAPNIQEHTPSAPNDPALRETSRSFITQPHSEAVVSTLPSSNAAGNQDEEEDEENEEEDDGDDREAQAELERQERELEEQIRAIEEQHKREVLDARSKEEERLHKLRLEAAKELQRVESANDTSDSDGGKDETWEGETQSVLSTIGLSMNRTENTVSGISQVIREQHQEMAKILESKKEEAEQEVTKAKASLASSRMKLAVEFFKKDAPPAPRQPALAVPEPTKPEAPSPPPSPPREETPLPLVKPLGRATTLPADQAPTSGWLPTSSTKITARRSNRVRVLRAPAVLQKEYAEQFGGQHRISTPALPVQPNFEARPVPPNLHVQPKHMFYAIETPRKPLQRPVTARGRLENHSSATPSQQCILPEHGTAAAANAGRGTMGTSHVYSSLFLESQSAPRRPRSARVVRQGSDYHTLYQLALSRIQQGEGLEGAVAPPAVQAATSQTHANEQGSGGLKGSQGSGRRIQSARVPRHPSLHFLVHGGQRERATGGMLASSPAPGRWSTGRDSKDPDFTSTIVASARLEIRPRSPMDTMPAASRPSSARAIKKPRPPS